GKPSLAYPAEIDDKFSSLITIFRLHLVRCFHAHETFAQRPGSSRFRLLRLECANTAPASARVRCPGSSSTSASLLSFIFARELRDHAGYPLASHSLPARWFSARR